MTPVHVAAIRGRLQNLHLLLLAGGDPQAVDEDGCSPMYYAHKEGHFSCVELLQSYKCILGKNNLPFPSLSFNKESPLCSEREKNVAVVQKSVSSNVAAVGSSQPSFHLADISEEEDASGCRIIYENTISALLPSKENVEIEPKGESVVILDNESLSDSDKNGKQLLDCWLATQSCFLKSYEMCHHENKSGNSEYSQAAVDSKSPLGVDDGINILRDNNNKAIAEKDVCDKFETEKNVLDMSFKLVGIDFSMDGDSNSVTSASNLTYDITDNDNFLHRTYNIFSDSILSSHRSSPILRARNIPLERNNLFEQSFLNRSYSDFSLSSISPLSEKKERYITYRKDGFLNMKFGSGSNISTKGSESEEYFTVPEDIYEYTDDEEGVALLGKRIQPVINGDFNILNNLQAEKVHKDSRVPRSSSEYSLSSYNTEDLKNEVRKAVSFGCCCPLGPITATTKRVYLRKIHNFKKEMLKNNMEPIAKPASLMPKFSSELERTLAKPWLLSHSKYIQVEQRMMAQFDEKKKFNHWREGSQKSSFNYLLLDPRITNNLPLRWADDRTKRNSLNSIGEAQHWKDFLTSIFYVGKGKRSRPYSHLYEAVSKKVKHILEIWSDNAGVVCLHVFQNSIPAEAFTREAAMIDALGNFSEKREFGSFLLHRALMIYLNEGERQLKPADID
ncbi:hypothetical protein J437_LFUL000708 [Ladona fulva]|uniref:LEM domain-containing protein n=1 Tax=Ladona fulva TaxID=123851 RepID=A0A8K0JUN9_LADFU|nr:hypothetical protein J437_LFUL000708 [Ladona fulva]